MSYYDREAGSMTYHPTHGHMHVDEWGSYTLRSDNGDPDPLNWPIIGSGAKLGFCLMDYGSCSTYGGHCVDSLGNTLLNGDFPNYGLGGGSYNCSSMIQGISSGYTDIYYQYLDGMYLDIPPGICNGDYYIVVKIDPNDYFIEENEDNNVIVVPYTLTKQAGTVPVVTASGQTAICPGDSVTLISSPSPSYLWSTGETTQSISVSQVGTYTVTTDVNTTCPASSQPFTVTTQTIPVTVIPDAGSICDGQSTTLNVTTTTPPTATIQTSFSNSTVINIPDNNSTGVFSDITVSGINPATLSSASVFSVQLNITHPYVGDLLISLISPSGNTIILSNRRGGSGDNFDNTTFSMSAITPIASGTPPYSGTYIPDEFFNLLTGDANGLWQLKVADLAGADIGTLNAWTLTLNNEVPVALNYSWTSVPPGFNSTDPDPIVTPLVSTTYNLTVTTSVNGCSGTAGASVTVNPNPVVTFTALNDVCYSAQPYPLVEGLPAGGAYSGTGVISNSFYPPVAGAGNHTLTYEYTDGNGCSGTATQTITVNTVPATPATVQGIKEVCPDSKQSYSVTPDPAATSYAWVVPSGVQILSGQGSNQIMVAFAPGYNTGNLCLYAANSCGSSLPQCVSLIRKHMRYCAIRPTNPQQRSDLPGEQDEIQNMVVSVMPNPAAGHADLVITGANEGTHQLIIQNVLGKQILNSRIQLVSGYNTVPLDLSSFAKGIYLITVSNGAMIRNSRLVVE
jgi:subtilisin-like proprotein convertase family protein